MSRFFAKWLPILVSIVLLVGCATAPTATAVPAATAVPPTAVPEPTKAPEPTEASAATGDLILATTTSTENSGLLAAILPAFESEYGVTVSVVAVGTGQALKLGEDGNADVLLVHARALEDAFMEAQHGTRREDVMYNDFVIVGPEGDPAEIKGTTDAAAAFRNIADAKATFVSRGDNSGTHVKELSVWTAAGKEPAGDWYISAGQGMGTVLTMADEQQAYTLSDRATYLARTLEGTELVILTEGDPVLFNPYGVIAVNPAKGAHIKVDLAQKFIDWLISVPAQEMIGQFGVAEFGGSLFVPDSVLWREAKGVAAGGASAVPADAALKITGMVTQEVGWTMDQLQAMQVLEVTSTNSKGESDTYSGILLSALLDLAGVQDGATTVSLVADDGYSVDVAVAEIMACADCIASFRSNGGLSSVLPGFPKNTGVKGLVEVRIN